MKRTDRLPLARQRVLDALAGGPRTADQIRRELQDLGRYGSREGFKLLISGMIGLGSIEAHRYRDTTTGPLIEHYSLASRESGGDS